MDKDIKNGVSIIIATFNGFRYIKEAIDSVLNQSFKNTEIIIVDDGSIDKKLEDIINFYLEKNLIIYKKKQNGGQGSARNVGIKIAQGKYVAFLDDDDYWAPNKLEKQFELMEKNNDGVLCYSNSFLLDSNNNILEKTSKEMCGKFFDGYILSKIVFKNFITLSSVLIKKSFLINNLFDEDSEIRRIEDYDLWLRLVILGKFYYLDESLVYYRTKLPLNNINKVNEYRRILKMFKKYILIYHFPYKYYYLLGWFFYFIKFIFFKIKKIYG